MVEHVNRKNLYTPNYQQNQLYELVLGSDVVGIYSGLVLSSQKLSLMLSDMTPLWTSGVIRSPCSPTRFITLLHGPVP
jgi:hypothetical protein